MAFMFMPTISNKAAAVESDDDMRIQPSCPICYETFDPVETTRMRVDKSNEPDRRPVRSCNCQHMICYACLHSMWKDMPHYSGWCPYHCNDRAIVVAFPDPSKKMLFRYYYQAQSQLLFPARNRLRRMGLMIMFQCLFTGLVLHFSRNWRETKKGVHRVIPLQDKNPHHPRHHQQQHFDYNNKKLDQFHALMILSTIVTHNQNEYMRVGAKYYQENNGVGLAALLKNALETRNSLQSSRVHNNNRNNDRDTHNNNNANNLERDAMWVLSALQTYNNNNNHKPSMNNAN